MKKLLFTTLLISSSFFVAFGQVKKVALISVYAGNDFSDAKSSNVLSASERGAKMDLSEVVEKFEQSLNKSILPEFPFSFKEKNEIVETPEYESIPNSDNSVVTSYVVSRSTAKGYSYINAQGITLTNKPAIKKSFAVFPDADAIAIAFITYKFRVEAAKKVGGIAKINTIAYFNFKIYNRKGKAIVKIREKEEADELLNVKVSIRSVADEQKYKELTPILHKTFEKVFSSMESKYPAVIANAVKKMK